MKRVTMWRKLQETKLISYLSLFSSFGTLLCCAIPSTLVLLGFGASVASFVGEFPQFIWLSDHKEWVFVTSFFMLFISYLSQKYSQKMSCPVDKKVDCQKAKGWARALWPVTLGLNAIGFVYAFVLPAFL